MPRDAVYDGEVYILDFHAAAKQLSTVAGAEAPVDRLRIPIAGLVESRATEADAYAGQAVLVRVDARQGLPPALGRPVHILRKNRRFPFDIGLPPVAQDRIDTAGKDDPLAACFPRGLESIIRADDVQRLTRRVPHLFQ